MIVIPAVELSDSRPSGRNAPRVHDHLSDLARSLSDLGFRRLHVLESGGESNIHSVEDIVRDSNARVQVGGVNSTAEIEQLLRAGVDHVVVGDRALDEPEWLADVADLYPNGIAVATDVRDRRVVMRGWVRTLPIDILDLIDELNGLPLRELLVTLRATDGRPALGELSLLEDVAERSQFPVTVVGAVARIEDLRALEHRGVAGAVIDAERLRGGNIDGRRVAQEFGA